MFYPEWGSVRIINELAFFMARKGHTISVVSTMPSATPSSKHECHLGVSITRLPFRLSSGSFAKSSLINHLILPVACIPYALSSGRKDVVECSNFPMTLWLAGYLVKLIRGSRLVIRVDDIHPQSAAHMGIIKNSLALWLLRLLSKIMYAKSDMIVVHSKESRRILVDEGAIPDKIAVVNLWADLDAIELSLKRAAHLPDGMFDGSFTVTFAGLISYAQGLDKVIQAARSLKEERGIRFLIIGRGPELGKLKALASKYSLENLSFWGFLPQDQYFSALRQSDVCLVTLSGLLKLPVVPSKFIDIMALGRCAIVVASGSTGAAQLLSDSQSGLVVEPNSPEKLAASILRLHNDAGLREKFGANGRKYVEEHLTLDICGGTYEEALLRLCNRKHLSEKKY